MILLAVAALGVDVADAPAPLRAVLTAAAALLLPGCAATARRALPDWNTAFATWLGLSLAIDTVACALMAWTHLWEPSGLALVLGGASVVVLLAAADRPRAYRGPAVAAALPLAAGLALWASSLSGIDAESLGTWGLAAALPISWYAALTLVVGGALWSCRRAFTHAALAYAYAGAVAVVLFGTIPAVAAVPQYSWVYKHIGVAHLIGVQGAVSPGVDIYNRWPGAFALGAAFSAITGADPVSWAGWFEPLFVVIDAALVAAIARAISRDAGTAALSGLLFVLMNWVGQDYFSPQAVAYALDLALMLVLIRGLPVVWGQGPRLVQVLQRAAGRSASAVDLAELGGWDARATLTAILVLDLAINLTHQLTPVMVVFQIAVLTLLGLRPRWLVVATGVLTLAYVAPNLPFLDAHYSIFSGLDPLRNSAVGSFGPPVERPWLLANAGRLLSLAGLALAGSGAIRGMRGTLGRVMLPPFALMLAPGAVLFVSDYGGEAILRVFLFALPWVAILAAMALARLTGRAGALAAAAVTALLGSLLVIAFLGPSAGNLLPADEVRGSQYWYAHAPAGSALMLAGTAFPTRVGARYAVMRGNPNGGDLDLLDDPSLDDHRLGPSDLTTVAADAAYYSDRPFIVFSTSQDRYAALFHEAPGGSLASLERAVAGSPLFSLWFENHDTRIYALTGVGCLLTPGCNRPGLNSLLSLPPTSPLPSAGAARRPAVKPGRRTHGEHRRAKR